MVGVLKILKDYRESPELIELDCFCVCLGQGICCLLDRHRGGQIELKLDEYSWMEIKIIT